MSDRRADARCRRRRPTPAAGRGLGALLAAVAALLGACTKLEAAREPRTLELVHVRPANPDGVLLNEELVFFLSTDVDRASVTRQSVRIRAADRSEARGSLRVEGQRIRFVPAPALASDLSDGGYRPGTSYEVELAGFPRPDGIRALAGDPLARTVHWSFRTVEVQEPRTRLVFEDRYQGRPKPLHVFPPPAGGPEAPYVIGPQGPVWMACEKPLDPASVRDRDFRFVPQARAGGEPVPARVRLVENEPVPAIRPRPEGASGEGWSLRPRAALLAIRPRQALAPGTSWTLQYDPGGPAEFSLRDFSAERVLEKGTLKRRVHVAADLGEAAGGSLLEDFADARLRSPLAVAGVDGTAHWGESGRVEVRWPAAAGDGAHGDVTLSSSEGRRDVRSLALDLAPGTTCELRPEPGLAVLRAQGRVTIRGRLVRRAEAPSSDPTVASWLARPQGAAREQTLSAWLARVAERDDTWTVIVAGGDLVVEGSIETTTPLLLCAGGVVRVTGAVRGVRNQVYLLREGGGLDIEPPATFAPLEIDVPVGPSPLARPLRFAVLSSPLPPTGAVRRWTAAEARGSRAGSGPDPRWRVRYLAESGAAPGEVSLDGAVESPLEIPLETQGGALRFVVELEVGTGGLWDPPWVDSVRLAWEQAAGEVR